jgi:ribosomal protein RSM22 (predicted rRNA methylase)
MTPPASMTLRASIAQTLASTRTTQLAKTVDALTTTYRSGTPPGSPILATELDVLAYAAYRMPATYAATHAVFEQLHLAVPDLLPRDLIDFGAGTGATAWAALDVWPDLTSLTMLEQSDAAIDVGRRIAENSSSAQLRAARWRRWQLGQSQPDDVSSDIAVAAYVLGELSAEQQRLLVETLAHAASTVVLVEPGTPAGYSRIITARDDLISRGLSVLAPCPHSLPCPLLAREGDWCHFAERLERSSTHRSVKSGELSYEDEKYAYIAASRTARPGASGRRPARILRHPTLRKGLVSLELCTEEGNAVELKVAKSEGEPYKQARRAHWGDSWPPSEHPAGSSALSPT